MNYLICPPDLEFELRELISNEERENYFESFKELDVVLITDSVEREKLINLSNQLDLDRLNCDVFFCYNSKNTHDRINGLWHYKDFVTKETFQECWKNFRVYMSVVE